MSGELIPCLEDWNRKGLSLFDFQAEGVKRMLGWNKDGHGGINADEMGLGKTCQAVVTMMNLASLGQGPFLVLAPLSVCQHWKDEVARFGCGILSPLKYIGYSDERSKILTDARLSSNTVFITAYHLFRSDFSLIADIQSRSSPFASIFVDEAQNLKNYKSQISILLREARDSAKFYLLTGTPIQNNLAELYSLLCFCHPARFPDSDDDFKSFEGDYGNRITDLKALLDKYMIRRTKDLVYDSLPKIDQVVVYHYLTDLQKKIYIDIISKNYDSFKQLAGSGKHQPLLNVLMQLRKCVNHPYMFEGVEPEPFVEGEHLVEASAKFLVLDKLLTFLQRRKHRVLIFSQFVMVLTLLQDYLDMRGLNYEVIDGTVKSDARTASIKRFQDKTEDSGDSNVFAFLLSTRAGGVGLNLTAADTVIFMDSDWNPQADIQAMARSHRIGQKKPVRVIRLIGKFTAEQVIHDRSSNKLNLSSKVMGDEGGTMSHVDLTDLIKCGLGRLSIHDPSDWSEDKLQSVVGGTDDNGCWLPRQSEKSADTPSDEINDYMTFEGKSYRVSDSDEGVFNQIITTAVSSKPSTSNAISSSDQEEKRRMAAEQRKEKALQRKLVNWSKNGYVSRNLPLEHGAGSAVNMDDTDEASIRYISGDVTKPLLEDRFGLHVLIHSVNDGGMYGTSGIFASFRSRFPRIPDVYEKISEMKDLNTGDSHYIPGADTGSTLLPVCDIVLAVTQKYRRMESMESSILEQCLKRVSLFVSQKSCLTAVHITRMGYGTNLSWYTVERLLQKYFIFKGISVIVYYFSRRNALSTKRKARSPPSDRDAKRQKSPSIEDLSSHQTTTNYGSTDLAPKALVEDEVVHCGTPLHDLSDVVLSLYQIDEKKIERYKLFIAENQGEYILDKSELLLATHCLVPVTITDTEEIEQFRSIFDSDCILLEERWILDSKTCLKNFEPYVV